MGRPLALSWADQIQKGGKEVRTPYRGLLSPSYGVLLTRSGNMYGVLRMEHSVRVRIMEYGELRVRMDLTEDQWPAVLASPRLVLTRPDDCLPNESGRRP